MDVATYTVARHKLDINNVKSTVSIQAYHEGNM